MTEGKRQIIQQLLQEYDIETAEDIHDALKDLLGGTIKEMMEAEMDDYRNGYKEKTVNSGYGSMRIDVPQDRKSTFEPKVLKKRQKDISDIDQKIISMYAKGMTTRQISDTLMDIYGFEASEGFISDVTDKILPFLYIDAIHYSVRDNGMKLIRSRSSIRTQELVEELELSPRTIQRYISTLQAAGEWIAYDHKKRLVSSKWRVSTVR
nr:transposase [Stomatobaculum longum]